MTTPRTLIKYIENNFSIEETILEVRELMETLKTDKDFVSKLRESLIEYSEEFNRCPECGQQLDVVDSYTEEHEFWGMPVVRYVDIYGCTCGYTMEEDR